MRTWLPLFLLTASLHASIDPLPPEQIVASAPAALYWQESKTDGLFVSLWTERLLIRSIQPQDLSTYCALFADPLAMEKYANGATRTPAETTQRFENSWLVRWQTGDPFSALAVTLVTPGIDPKDYPVIGHVIMGHGDEPGQSELAYALFPEFWNQGYGWEAVSAVARTFGAELVQKGCEVEGKPFSEIVATTRVDNIASYKILKDLGMQEIGRSEKYGHERVHFSITTENLSR